MRLHAGNFEKWPRDISTSVTLSHTRGHQVTLNIYFDNGATIRQFWSNKKNCCRNAQKSNIHSKPTRRSKQFRIKSGKLKPSVFLVTLSPNLIEQQANETLNSSFFIFWIYSGLRWLSPKQLEDFLVFFQFQRFRVHTVAHDHERALE